MNIPLSFQNFNLQNYPEYKSWYKDKQLQKALGPLNEDWLNHILHSGEGSELAIFSGTELVAVVGITLQHDQYNYRVITNIAVKPTLRNQGLGGKILLQLFEEVPLRVGEYWVAYVDRDNACAEAFFTKQECERVEEADMIRFEFRGGAAFVKQWGY